MGWINDKNKKWKETWRGTRKKANIKKEGENRYLFDYGDKITDEEDKKIFDFMNYIHLFNDLIRPN